MARIVIPLFLVLWLSCLVFGQDSATDSPIFYGEDEDIDSSEDSLLEEPILNDDFGTVSLKPNVNRGFNLPNMLKKGKGYLFPKKGISKKGSRTKGRPWSSSSSIRREIDKVKKELEVFKQKIEIRIVNELVNKEYLHLIAGHITANITKCKYNLN